MASVDEAIVLDDKDDDNEDDDDAIPINNRQQYACSDENESKEHSVLIDRFMEILNENDRSFARSQLQTFGFNLEDAITQTFEARQVLKKSNVTDLSSRSLNQMMSQSDDSIGSSSIVELICNTTESQNGRDDVVGNHKGQLVDTRHECNDRCSELSSAWNACYEQSPTPFVDPDFPPSRVSLDGRKEDTISCANKTVRCYCKLPAAARSVQSDGPNYGRFYLACGQKNRRRQRTQQHDISNNDNVSDNSKKHNTSLNGSVKNQGEKNGARIRNPYSVKKRTESLERNETRPPSKPCNFFQWDKDGSAGSGYNTQWSSLAWHHFDSTQRDDFCNESKATFVLYHKNMTPCHVRQGAVGNCWFLSALAVVAEKEYLVQKLVPHKNLNAKGCYQINLCLDGKWTPVLVDSYLPVMYAEQEQAKKQRGTTTTTSSSRANILSRQEFRGGVALQGGTVMAIPAFCAIPQGQLWAALIEKAYAKAHGSYSQLSGGFIAEGLEDLTGAPTETIVLDSHLHDNDELWLRLLSFSEAGYLLGVATSRGGDGLVGGHAYSILDVKEIQDTVVGEQQKVTDFFPSPSKKSRLGPNIGLPSKEKQGEQSMHERGTVRLVRIRNPWGKREWKGAWSVNSETWTNNLRKHLGSNSWAKDDGTFWMSFDDMVERFHHMDICKTRKRWSHISLDGWFEPRDPIQSSKHAYSIKVNERTWAFISILQPKKRANTATRYWYSDPSMIILKRKARSKDEWTCETGSLVGVARRSDCEVFLDPAYEYCVIPFSNIPSLHAGIHAFRLVSYSASPLAIQEKSIAYIHSSEALLHIHKELLKNERRLLYSVSPQGILACLHGKGCMYFVAINASYHHFLSLKLTIEEQSGQILTFGKNNDTHDVRPRTQKVLVVVSTDGKQSSATQLKFKYIGDVVTCPCNGKRPSYGKNNNAGLGSGIDITLSGDLIASETHMTCGTLKGGDTIDTYLWIPQLGKMQ